MTSPTGLAAGGQSQDGQEFPDFGEGAYWEEHYAKAAAEGEDVYDWLVGWAQLQWLLEPLLARDLDRKVLHLGNGNSPLPEEMFDVGYHNQTAVDISQVVMDHMEHRNRHRPSIRWIMADCRNLAEIADDSFPLVVDKSTLDAFFCNDQHALAIMEFLKEAYRVTSVGGAFISVSMHRPKASCPGYIISSSLGKRWPSPLRMVNLQIVQGVMRTFVARSVAKRTSP